MSTPIDSPAEETLTKLAERFEHWRRTRLKGHVRIPACRAEERVRDDIHSIARFRRSFWTNLMIAPRRGGYAVECSGCNGQPGGTVASLRAIMSAEYFSR